MDNIHFIYFACLRDLPLLEVSIASIKRGFPDAWITAFFDQSEEPGANCLEIWNQWERVAWATTDFPRGYSLNQSPECIAGMLKAYHETGDSEHILKIDCDTALTESLDPSTFEGFDLIGQGESIEFKSQGQLSYAFPYARGHAYVLSRRVVNLMLNEDPRELLRAADTYVYGMLSSRRPHPITWPEDETFSVLARMLSPDPNKWALYPKAPHPFVANYDFALQNAPAGIFTNFGELLGVKKEEGRETILQAMKGLGGIPVLQP